MPPWPFRKRKKQDQLYKGGLPKGVTWDPDKRMYLLPPDSTGHRTVVDVVFLQQQIRDGYLTVPGGMAAYNQAQGEYNIGRGGDVGGPGSSNDRLGPLKNNTPVTTVTPPKSAEPLATPEPPRSGGSGGMGSGDVGPSATHEIKPAGDINRSAGFHSDVLATTTSGGSAGSSSSTPANAGSESISKGDLGASTPAAVFSPTPGGTADQIEAKALAKNALDPAIARAIANHEEATAGPGQTFFGGHFVGVDDEPLTPPRPATSSSTPPAATPAPVIPPAAVLPKQPPDELVPLHGSGTPIPAPAPATVLAPVAPEQPQVEPLHGMGTPVPSSAAAVFSPTAGGAADRIAAKYEPVKSNGVTAPLPRHLSRPDEDLDPFGAFDSTPKGRLGP